MTTAVIILYNDQIDTASFTGSPTWTADIANVATPFISQVARSVDATNANTKFKMTFPAAISTSAVVLVATNASATATYRIRAYSDAGFTVQVFDSGTNAAWTSASPISDPDDKGIPIVALFSTTVSARYWLVEIFDASNADGFIEIGHVFVGTGLTTTFSAESGARMRRVPNTEIKETVAGARFYNRHVNRRTWSLSYGHETYANAWDEFDKMFEVSSYDRQLYVIPFPDDAARMFRHSFLCNLTDSREPEFEFVAGNFVATGMDLIEVVA